MPHWTALTTIASLIVYFAADLRVGKARGTYKIKAPAISGDPAFERIFRAHQNTLEWMVIFLPALWLFALYVSDAWAALIGMVWIGGRILYLVSYARAADKRGPGFALQALASATLVGGGLFGIVRALIAG